MDLALSLTLKLVFCSLHLGLASSQKLSSALLMHLLIEILNLNASISYTHPALWRFALNAKALQHRQLQDIFNSLRLQHFRFESALLSPLEF